PYADSARTKNKSESWIKGLDCFPLQTYSQSKQRTRMVVGESSQPHVKDTTLTFQCPILTSTNYTIWRMRMEVLLEIHGEAIKTPNLGADSVKDARLQTLIIEFETMKMFDNGTKDEYAVKLSGIASKSVTLREVMSKHKLVKKFLTSLPRHFVHIVAALEQVLDLKMTGFEDVDVAHILEVVDEVEVKDVVGATRKTKVNVTPRKNVMIIDRKRDYEANLSETHEGDVNHKEGSEMVRVQATIFGYDISSRGEFLTMRDSWGSLIIKVSRSVNRLYKAQLKLGKEGTNEVGRESNKKVNPHSSSVTVYKTNQDSEEDKSGSNDTSISIARIETIRLLIALAAGKRWKIHHLDVKTAFLNSDRMKLDNLGELTYYLGIEVSRGKDCIEIKQERYAMKILKDAGMEDCNVTLCPIEPKLKLLKAKDEPEVETTQYRKMVGCLRFLLHTRPDLTYSVGVVSRYTQSPRESHARAIKQILWYLKALLDTFFYLGTSPITWCSQKKTIVALSSCEAEFMAATAAACQAIWLRELLVEVTGLERQKVIIRVDNKSGIALSKDPVFHGRSIHIHTRYHFNLDCVIIEHVSEKNERAGALTMAVPRIRFKEMRSLLGV
nr:hypothetical protein [Tanacetum cinerariifolium]